MTVQTPEQSLPAQPSWQDDEIDLRAYVLVLAQWWREIVLITLLAAAAAFGGTYFLSTRQTDRYTATASVVLARFVSQVQLDERVSTVMDTGGGDAAWRSSTVQLVNNGTIAAAVFADLGDRLPDKYQSPASLLNVVEAEIAAGPDGRTPSNILNISATTQDPALSALIADTWTRHFMRYINSLYGEIPQETIDSVQTDLDRARREWEVAEADYERAVASNRLAEYQNELDTKLALLDTLLTKRRDGMAALATTEFENRTSIYNAIARAQAANIATGIANEQAGAVQALAHLQRLRLAADVQLTQAAGLVRLLEEGGDPATTAEALRQIKLQVFAATPPGIGVPGTYTTILTQDGAAQVTSEALLADARLLVDILAANRAVLDAAIATQSDLVINQPAATALGILADGAAEPGAAEDAAASALATLSGESSAALLTLGDWVGTVLAEEDAAAPSQQIIAGLEAEIRALRGEIAALTAAEREITLRRDLAWTSYDALSSKLVELNLMRTSANSQVRLASLAVPPLDPEPKISYTLPVAGATGAAFVFAIFLALFVNMMGGKPLLARR